MSWEKISYKEQEGVLRQSAIFLGGALEKRGYAGKICVKAYRYGFNGKERDNNQEWGLTSYDYGFRIYNPAIGRWLSVDPYFAQYPEISPYQYTLNNPIYYIDPDGNRPWPVHKKYGGKRRRIASWFGKRTCDGCSSNHKGLDVNFGAGMDDYGAPVLATHDGTIVSVKNTLDGSGRNVLIQSPDGKFQTQYFHLKGIDVKEGEYVSESDEIGQIGGSGNDSELGYKSHLHYAIKVWDESKKKYVWFDPAEGKGKKEKNIVDPQKWVNVRTLDEVVVFYERTPEEMKEALKYQFSELNKRMKRNKAERKKRRQMRREESQIKK